MAENSNSTATPDTPENPFAVSESTESPDNTPIVDCILPSREVHLWSGTSGVGKTAFLFQTLADWVKGLPVLGYASHPVPFCYVACERSREHTLSTMSRVGINPQESHIPVVSAFDRKLRTMDEVGNFALTEVPDAKLLILDGITRLVPGNPNHASSVGEWFTQAGALIQSRGVTILAVTCASKAKEGERYLSPRQRISGSSAWGAMAGTVVVIEDEKSEDPRDLNRTMFILPLNSPPKILHYTLDDRGRFKLTAKEKDVEAPNDFEILLFARPVGAYFTTKDVDEICDSLGISRRTGYRYVTTLISYDRVRRVTNGMYQVTSDA